MVHWEVRQVLALVVEAVDPFFAFISADSSIQPQRGDSTFGLVGYSNNGRPVGAWMQGGIRFQGLTPLAIGLSPVGTKNNMLPTDSLSCVFWLYKNPAERTRKVDACKQ